MAGARGGHEGGSFLDVASGSGTVDGCSGGAGLGGRNGVDADASMIEAARRRHPGIDFRRAALPDLPFADGSHRVGADGMLRLPHTAILVVGVKPA